MSEIISQKTINLFNEYFCLIKTLNKDNNDFDINSIDLISEKLKKIISIKQMIALINENNLWTKFLRKTLKTSLNEQLIEIIGEKLLELIIDLMKKLSVNEISLETTLELICGHSMFNTILIDEKYITSQIKYQLVLILSLIYEKDLNLINNYRNNNEIIAIVLSAYNLSLAKTDQNLLKLLSFMEKNGLNLYRFQPFLWGVNGAIHYSIKNKQKETLLKEPKMEQILSSINENQLKNTLNQFPIDLTLSPIQVIDVQDGQELTDPRFLLPLFYQLLSNQSLVKCHKFVSYGCLSYAIGGLSSLCDDMRCLAYSVLSRFHSHLQMASFPKDRFLWIAIIDCIRSGVTEDNIRLKSLISVFLIRIIDVLLHPNDKLYETVRKFLMSRPTVHFNVLPDFYTNLFSSDNETHKRLQRFIISWICDGLRTEEDIKLCLKRNVFSDLFSLFDSDLSEEENRVLILKIFQRMSRQYMGAKVLCTENALFCWSKQTIFNLTIDSNSSVIIEEIFKIIETVCQTLDVQNINQNSKQLLYPSFCEELIDILENIIQLNPLSERIDFFDRICHQMNVSEHKSELFFRLFEILPKNVQ